MRSRSMSSRATSRRGRGPRKWKPQRPLRSRSRALYCAAPACAAISTAKSWSYWPMSTQSCNPKTHHARHRNSAFLRLLALALTIVAPGAHALGSDRDQKMDISADHAKIIQGSDKAPGVTYLTGNVRITRGSMKATSAEATIYQHPGNAKDAQGKDISSAV